MSKLIDCLSPSSLIKGLAVVACVILSSNLAEATAADGEQAYKRGDYSVALEEWTRAAQEGEPAALNGLGKLYVLGRGVEKNIPLAIEYFERAAITGYPLSIYNLGVLHFDGVGVPQNRQLGLKYITEAAKRGQPLAQYVLGGAYLKGLGVAKNYQEAFTWYMKAAKQGDADAQSELGWMLANGIGHTKDYKKAKVWFEKSARQKNALGTFNLALIYLEGWGVERDTDQGLRLLQRAAELGLLAAQFKLGHQYIYGKNENSDPEKGVFWLEKAAKRRHVSANYVLAFIYKIGKGVDKDDKKAVIYLKTAADLGDTHAQSLLGIRYYNGKGVEKSPKNAVKWYRKAAKAGDAYSQFALANMLSKGNGVKKDPVLAATWMRSAAIQNYLAAQTSLGQMYRDGKGVKKDYNEARKWLSKAVESGYDFAKPDLAQLYLEGLGTNPNPEYAITLLQEAAQKGNQLSEFLLARIYFEGRYVAKHDERAVHWLQKLADRGNAYGITRLATFYLSGKGGITKNVNRAIELLRNVAEKGHGYPQSMLAEIYSSGKYISYDFAKSFYWYEKFAKQNGVGGHLGLATHYAQGLGIDQDSEKALTHYRTALRLIEEAQKSIDRPISQLANIYTVMGQLEEIRGNHDKSERYFKRAITISERAKDTDILVQFETLMGLASSYLYQNRVRKAEALYLKARKLIESYLSKSRRTEITDIIRVRILFGFGLLYERQGYLLKAKSSLAKGVEIIDGSPKNILRYANFHGRLARVLTGLGEFESAAKLFESGLENLVGNAFVHKMVRSRLLADFASLKIEMGLYHEAIDLYKQAADIAREIKLTGHPVAIKHAGRYAGALGKLDRWTDAIKILREAANGHAKRSNQLVAQLSEAGIHERREVRGVLQQLVRLLTRSSPGEPFTEGALDEAFTTAQLTRGLTVPLAIRQMVTRISSRNARLAKLIRERQNAVFQWRILDRVFSDRGPESFMGPGIRSTYATFKLASVIENMDRDVTEIDRELRAKFPEFANLIVPGVLKISQVKLLLRAREALLLTLVGNDKTRIWIVTNESSLFYESDLGSASLGKLVRDLRGSLDPGEIQHFDNIPDFPLHTAHRIYREILAPASNILKNIDHLVYVPDGPLQSLPLGLLVTALPDPQPAHPKSASTDSGAESRASLRGFTSDVVIQSSAETTYRRVSWLIRRYSVSVLPSVASLKALRAQSGRSQAKQNFVGFGNPVLAHNATARVGIEEVYTSRGVGVAAKIRQLPSLPHTADELKNLLTTIGAGNGQIFLGWDATEKNVRDTKLNDFKVLAFATHALVAGEIKGVAEPALVLTPPLKTISTQNDGLLTASEIAALELDADLVILSACNTAAPDGSPTAEGLSGLARSFFYAGARSLLVSHWSVASQAAAAITTGMFEGGERTNWAKSLQKSVIRLMSDKTRPDYYAHPMFWAPFSVVGEGGPPTVEPVQTEPMSTVH